MSPDRFDLGRLRSTADRLRRVAVRRGPSRVPGRVSGEAPKPGRNPAMSRMGVVFLVVGIMLAGVLYDRVDIFGHEHTDAVDQTIINPSVSDPAPLDGAWYCPMGSSSPTGIADNVIHISNLSENPAVANVVVVTGEGGSRSLTARRSLAPLSTTEIPLSQYTQSDVAGAVVEIIGGTGVVGHTVQTAVGQAEGPCSTSISSSWYFASGRTTRDSKQYLALMNPFPEDVRYNVELYRSAGQPRKPAALTGQEVPANSIRVVEIGSYVAREDAVAAAVTTDRGRLVVERLETLDGALGPSGAALQLGVAAPAQSWMLPAGRIHDGGDDRVVVFNPSAVATAEVDVELWPLNPTDRSLYGLGAIPRQLAPGRFEVIDLRTEAQRYGLRLPYDVGVSVASTNDVPVVVERWQFAKQIDTNLIGAGGNEVTTTAPAAGATPDPNAPGALDLPGIFGSESEPLTQPTANAGVATSRGTEVLSTRWVIPWITTPNDTSTVVVVVAPKKANVEVFTLVNGEMQGPIKVTVDDQGRAVIPLAANGARGMPVLVTADTPVSVEGQVVVVDGKVASVAGVPTVPPVNP